MPEVHYELVKLKRNVAWKRGREEAEVLLQALLVYATTNQLAKYQEQLKGMVKLSPENWLPGNKLSVQWTTLENLAELTKFAKQEGICSKSLDTTRENKKKRQVGNALECLKSLGVCEGGAIQSGSNIWEFQLQLKSQDVTENLKWLFKLGGEWDRRYQEWQRRYKNGGGDEESGTLQPELSPASSPYRGLFAFGVDDEQFFFGRENFTEKLVKAVHSKPAIAVIGSSGSGKSSVVLAGLIPKLGKDWCIVTFRPGDRPFHALAAKLVPLLYPDPLEQVSNGKNLAEKFRQGDSELQDIAEFILRNHSDVRRLLLVVDQFEELYTLCQEEEERKRFLDLLSPVVPTEAYQSRLDFTVVITLRADFCGLAYSDPQFTNAFKGDADERLDPMNRQDLQRAIEEPARLLGVELQEGLTQRILDDVGEKPGNLPLLEFALDLLWKKQNDRTLTHAAYDEIGGVRKALAERADAVYKQLSEEDRKRAQQIFTQLVCPGEGTEDTRSLATRDNIDKKNWDLVTRFANEKVRLVVTGQDELTGKETVEIIHEALIKEWKRLREWMEDAREFLTWQKRLRFRMAQWENSGKDKGELLRGAPLVEAEKWLEEQCDRIPENEQAFIQVSREYQEQEEQRERELRRQAEISAIEALSSLSQALFPTDQLGALLAAVKAGRKLQVIEVPPALKISTLARLHQAVYGVQELNRLQGHKSIVTSVSCSPNPNSKMLASASEDGTVRLWSFDGTFEDLKYEYGYHKILDISFCPSDSQLLAVASLEAASLLNLEDNKLKKLKHLPHSDCVDYVESISFSPDGKLLASIDDRGTVKLWRLNSDKPQTFQDRYVRAVSFSPNSQLLACATWETLELWSLDGIIQKTFISRKGLNIKSVCFSPNGQKLAAVSWKFVFLWSLDNSEPQIYEHSYTLNNVSFSPDGLMLASASSDGTIKLWRLDGDELHELQIFRGHRHRAEINKVSFSSDGCVLASAGQDGTVRLWSIESRKLPTLRGHSKGINKISFSPDGEMLASASNDGTVKLWSIDGRELNTFSKHKDLKDKLNTCIKCVSFSPNGETLISFCDRGNVKIWNINGLELNTFNVEAPFGVYDMSLSPDGQTLVITDEADYKNINLWSINGTRIKPLGEAPWWTALSPPIFTSFSHDGHTIACADRQGQVKLYSYDDGYDKELKNFEAHKSPINGISFSIHGLLALAGEDGTVSVWTVDGNEFKTFHAHGGEVTSVSFSPNGKILASASDDRTVKLWTIEGIELHTFEGHTDAVNSVSFSPNGKMLASASTDGTIILWNLNLDELLVQGCNWLRDYLKTNPNISESDRHLCDGIGTQK
jgi:WD40 repeat protein